jgi:acetylornithine deacetylase
MTDALDPVALAIDLMRIDSTTGREGEMMAYVERRLIERRWHVRRISVTPERDDILATAGADPAVTLSTHLDTVPPYIPPRVADGKLWGRGSCDAKGIAAAMWCAAERLRERGVAVALLFVVGEEVSHDGARAANKLPTTSRVLINGEPTESTLALGTKGALRVTVRVRGEAAHSAYPHLGRSAIDLLVTMLGELRAIPLPEDSLLGATTINVGLITGGVADNVIAPHAEARIVVRLVGRAEEMQTLLERWCADRAELEITAIVPAVRLSPLDGFPTSVVAFATDVPVLSNWGTPYLYGPGSVHVAHRDDEHVKIEELKGAIGAYEAIAMKASTSP